MVIFNGCLFPTYHSFPSRLCWLGLTGSQKPVRGWLRNPAFGSGLSHDLYPYAPCMVYLPTFGWFFMQMLGFIFHAWSIWDRVSTILLVVQDVASLHDVYLRSGFHRGARKNMAIYNGCCKPPVLFIQVSWSSPLSSSDAKETLGFHILHVGQNNELPIVGSHQLNRK